VGAFLSAFGEGGVEVVDAGSACVGSVVSSRLPVTEYLFSGYVFFFEVASVGSFQYLELDL
jgi:hypothetical protein